MRLLPRLLAALLLLLGATPALAQGERIAAVVAEHGFKGHVLVARGSTILYETPRAGCPPPVPGGDIVLCHLRDPGEMIWPWASVSKQVVATLVMQQVAEGRIALDEPAATYLPALAKPASPTVRQLLQHRAGLRNSDDTPLDAEGRPSFYTTSGFGLNWCLTERGAPGGEWRYNNCDYLVLAAMLEHVTATPIAELFRRRIAQPLGLRQAQLLTGAETNLVAGNPRLLAGFGASAGFAGTPHELLRFDRALLEGTLLPTAARDAMWKGDPALGYMGLGQWVFSAPLKGCAAPARIVERRGGVLATQVRNILLPDQDMAIILFLQDADFDFGEIWQGKGLSHDLLSAAACG